MSATARDSSFLATRRGKLTLAFLCGVGFLDFVDASIVNVALPSIRADLHFSIQSLQWVLSGYLLTYGGFMLLGGPLVGTRDVLLIVRATDDAEIASRLDDDIWVQTGLLARRQINPWWLRLGSL